MLRIGIIGCGKVADQHVEAIRRIRDCTIVALCDRELLMARQLGERFGISTCVADLKDLPTEVDVVHITTPPQGHYPLARKCLESNRNVYLEKPFTVTAEEAKSLVGLAEQRNLKLTAGHNLQCTLESLEMRRLVKQGFLGGKPGHVESYFSYDLSDTSYVGPILASSNHWVRQLPGQLLQNIISHGLAKLAEFLDDDLDEIVASAHQSPRLRQLGGKEVLDELRVMIRDRSGTTAYFCFSTQLKPGLNQLRVFGPANSLVVDHGSGSLIRNQNRSSKSYLTYVVPPLCAAREHFRCARVNVVNFLRHRLYQDYGMKELIEQFYNSIRTSGAPPIPYREIVLTARIMDRIFNQIYRAEEQTVLSGPQSSHLRPLTADFPPSAL